MSVFQPTLTWLASADPKYPFANTTANFATDRTWNFGCIGTYLDKELRPQGFTVDNTANNANVLVNIGPVQFQVNQYARQSYAIPNGTTSIILVGTTGSVGILFFVGSLAPTADGANAFAIQSAVATVSASLNSSAMNAIINSQFSVFPQGTSINITAAAYGPEGWQAKRSSGTVNVSQATGIIGSLYSAQVQRPAADATGSTIEFWTQLPTVDSIQYQAQTITCAFDVVFGTDFDIASLVFSLIAGVGSDQNLITGFTGQATVASVTVAKSTTGARVSMSGTVPVNATQLALYVPWVNPASASGANNWFRVSRWQFDVGTTAQAYRPVPDMIELHRCERYFERIGQAGTGPRLGVGQWQSATTGEFQVFYTSKKRLSSPALTLGAGAANYGAANAGGGFTALSTLTLTRTTDGLATLGFTTAAGGVSGNATALAEIAGASSWIEINARM